MIICCDFTMNAATCGLLLSYSNLQNTFQMKGVLITGLPVNFLEDDKSISLCYR